MSDTLTLSAETRERAGKGASRAVRREGRVPAVIYGNKAEPLSIHLEEKALTKMLGGGHFMNSVVMIEGVGEAVRTLPKDVQFHPVTDRPLHVDFLRISEHASVHVNVPVRFTDEEESPGIKRGGVLNVVRHDIELVVDAGANPGRGRRLAQGFRGRRFDPRLRGHAARRRQGCDRGSRFHHCDDRRAVCTEELRG